MNNFRHRLCRSCRFCRCTGTDKPATAGAAAIANPHRPTVSTIVESPMSGFASPELKIQSLRHLDRGREPLITGAADTDAEFGSVPFIAVTTLEPSISRTGSIIDFPIAIAIFKKN